MYEGDDYKWGRQQAENGTARDPWSGRMSRDEIRGYQDEMDRQRRQREEREATWATPVAGGGGEGGGWLGLAVLGFFAVVLAVQFVITYWKPLLLGVATVAGVAALAWSVAQIPSATWRRWGRGAWHVLGRTWHGSVAGARATRRQIARLRRLALARFRGRSLPAVERIGRR